MYTLIIALFFTLSICPVEGVPKYLPGARVFQNLPWSFLYSLKREFW
jgi:hypothetical protein